MNQVGDLIRIDQRGAVSIDYDTYCISKVDAFVEKRSDFTILTKNEEHYDIVFAGKKVIYSPHIYDDDECTLPKPLIKIIDISSADSTEKSIDPIHFDLSVFGMRPTENRCISISACLPS